jgi:peptidoglycan/xylan/chitin deacetylase (PgdA/CDA1 family)
VKAALASAIVDVHDRRLGAMLSRRPARPLILGYHRVVDDFASAAKTEMPSMLVSRAMFERHIDCIGRHFTFVSLDEVGERLASGRPFTRTVAAITFDDGYRDVYEQAYPLLKRKGIPASIFVVTDLVGQPFWQHHDRLYCLVAKAFSRWDDPRRELLGLLRDLRVSAAQALGAHTATDSPLTTVASLLPALSHTDVDRVLEGLESVVGNGFGPAPLALTWPMLIEMRRAGFVIGSHTRTHVSLPTESAESVAAELEGSKRELERQMGEPVPHVAYPGGQFCPSVIEAAHRAGYRFGYTACRHRDTRYPLLTMERLLLWEGSSVDADGHFSGAILSCQASGLWPPARRCRVHHV